MSNRGRTILRRLCKRVVIDSRIFGKGRRTLKTLVGSPVEKVAAVKRVETYLPLMRVGDVPHRNLPSELFQTVAALRKTASDRRMSSHGRVVAISRLMLIEGFEVEQYWTPDATDDFIQSLLNIKVADREPLLGKWSERFRESSRKGALDEIRCNYLLDLGEGRFLGLSPEEIAPALRYGDVEPVQKSEGPSPSEVHRDAVDRTLQMFRNSSGGHDVKS